MWVCSMSPPQGALSALSDHGARPLVTGTPRLVAAGVELGPVDPQLELSQLRRGGAWSFNGHAPPSDHP